jgi:hypothetical protein
MGTILLLDLPVTVKRWRNVSQMSTKDILYNIFNQIIKHVGDNFYSTRSKEETAGLSGSPIPGDRHSAAIREKSGIIYSSRSELRLYSKLN